MIDPAMTMRASPTSIDDLMLAQRVFKVLENMMPRRVSSLPIHVQVGDGVVILRGVVASNLFRARILQAVRDVPGVRQVRDELWV